DLRVQNTGRKELERTTDSKFPSPKPRQFSKKRVDPRNIVLNKAIMNARSATDIFDLWEKSQKDGPELNAVNFSTAFNRISKLSFEAKDRGAAKVFSNDQSVIFSQMTQKALTVLSDFEARELSNTANSFSKIDKRREYSNLFEKLKQELLKNECKKLKKCNSQELANIANAFSKMNVQACDLFQEIKKALLLRNSEVLKKCNSQELANISNAFSKMNVPASDLFQEIKSIL